MRRDLGTWEKSIADLRRAEEDAGIEIREDSHSGLMEFIKEHQPKAGDLTVTLEGNFCASWSHGSSYKASIEFRSPYLCTLVVSDGDRFFHLTATGYFEQLEELTHHVGANPIMFEEQNCLGH